MLAMAEFTYNNSNHSATKISPYYTNYGFEPQTIWPTAVQFRNPALELYGNCMKPVHWKLSKQLEQSIEMMLKYYNQRRKSIEPFKKGELVMLNGKNICSKPRFNQLDD
jgi:hypothetical protein